MKAGGNPVILSSLGALSANGHKILVLKRCKFGVATLNTAMLPYSSKISIPYSEMKRGPVGLMIKLSMLLLLSLLYRIRL